MTPMPDRLHQAGRLIGRGALGGAKGVGRGLRWVFINSTVDTGNGPRRVGDMVESLKATGRVELGPSEPIDDRLPGESFPEYLRRKHNADMGADYGPHDDLQEEAYIKDWKGNLKPYRPK